MSHELVFGDSNGSSFEPTTLITNELKSDTSLEDRLIAFLHKQNGPIPTIEIAREMFGKGTPKKMVNPTLYKLEKTGNIIKTAQANGGDPHWSIKL